MNTYGECRDAFVAAAERAGFVTMSRAIDARGPDDETLFIDVAERGSSDRALVVLGGLHGVEGYTGSAVQRALVEAPPSGVREIFVHGINPWGMAWRRRVNENNVDLNRNFRDPKEAAPEADPEFRALYDVLHPTGIGGWDPGMILKVVFRMLLKGYPKVKQAVTAGQYTFPHGLFFGGNEVQQSTRIVEEELAPRLKACKHVAALDLHTGLGKRGTHTVLSMYDDDERHRFLVGAFGDRVSAMNPSTSRAYDIEGGLCRALPTWCGGECLYVTQEHGSENAVEVLVSLVREHQVHRVSPNDVEHPDKHRLVHAFAADNDAAVRHATQVYRALLGRLKTRTKGTGSPSANEYWEME